MFWELKLNMHHCFRSNPIYYVNNMLVIYVYQTQSICKLERNTNKIQWKNKSNNPTKIIFLPTQDIPFHYMNRCLTNQTIWALSPVKTYISLNICPVWSEASLWVDMGIHYFSYFCSEHKLWILFKTTSMGFLTCIHNLCFELKMHFSSENSC